jgi:hypothetical protein
MGDMKVRGENPHSWDVPWLTRTASLTVEPWLVGSSLSIRLDGSEIGGIEGVSLTRPWVELVIQRTPVEIKVVRLVYSRHDTRSTVFVGGVNLDDGRPESEWLADCPAPMDKFEATIVASPYFGVRAAVLVGSVVGAPGIVGWVRSGNTVGLVLGAAGFAVAAGWVLLNCGLALWLRNRRSWSSGLRIGIVAFTTAGLPFFVIWLLAGASN